MTTQTLTLPESMMTTPNLITLALARWTTLYGEPSLEDYRLIVKHAHEVNGTTPTP